jgi:glucose/arabinose dehydrogenase
VYLLAALLAMTVVTSSAASGAAAPLDEPGVALRLEPVLTGTADPVFVTHAGDGSGRLFVVERPGTIRVADGGGLLPQPFLDIRSIVAQDSDEMGLLGLAFHPRYAQNGYFFVAFTGTDQTNTVMRFRVSPDPNAADPSTSTVILSLPDRAPGFHNGGMLAFGPDGYLYIGTGDEGHTAIGNENPQNLQSLFGKMLRLDIDGAEPYGIPPDNPFVGRAEARPEIWSWGLRNPWRYSFDRATGDLFIADAGQDRFEEVDFQPAASRGGENYGWNRMEGRHCFPPESDCDPAAYVPPIAEYSHDDGCVIIGGYVYRGTESPALVGAYLYADICSGKIWSLRRAPGGDWSTSLLLEVDLSITSFGEDERGELYVTAFGGAVFHLAAGGDNPTPVIRAVSPWGIVAGAGTTDVHVRGDGFVPGAVIRWNGADRPTTFVDSTHLVAAVDPVDVRDPTTVTVTVANPSPESAVSPPMTLAVVAAAGETDHFEDVWQRTDLPVSQGQVSRTWLWGTGSEPIVEPYADSPSGRRIVRYYDKARMEVSQPAGDATSPWYVTNGLLVVELITGRMQFGDATFEQRRPSSINVAGDLDDLAAPTYASFITLLEVRVDQPEPAIDRVVRRNGTVYNDPRLAAYGVGATSYSAVTQHWIAAPFWEFMNAGGLVYQDDVLTNAPLFPDPYYATGHPIAEAYWAYVTVGGVPRDVLIQCFERRCLTFTPDNPTGWQVEAGNVGQHYFRWRYGG